MYNKPLEVVRSLQARVNQLLPSVGPYTLIQQDGVWGPQTRSAVTALAPLGVQAPGETLTLTLYNQVMNL